MTPKLTLSVSDELRKKMDKWRNKFNFSRICQDAIEMEIMKKERFLEKKEGQESVAEIMARADFDTEEGQYATGKDLGFFYAKTAPYPEIKALEHYVEGYEAGDAETVEGLHYDLDLPSLAERIGAFSRDVDHEPLGEDEIRKLEEEGKLASLTDRFDRGFMDGIVEFIKEECSVVEVSKIVLKRDKELMIAKDESDRLRIIKKYMPEIDRAIQGDTAKQTD